MISYIIEIFKDWKKQPCGITKEYIRTLENSPSIIREKARHKVIFIRLELIVFAFWYTF